MASNLIFRYGDYNFRPRPIISIDSQPLKTSDGIGYGVEHTISLDGDLITTGNFVESGIVGVFEQVEDLKDALSQDGRLLVIACDTNVIISGYPEIESYDITPESDNYTRRAGYNVVFKVPTTILGSGNDPFNGATYPPFIESCNESWDVEFRDERLPFDWTLSDGTVEKFGYTMAVTHTVNVQARLAYTGTEVSNVPWEDARDYATSKLGFDGDFVTLTGVLNLPGSGYFTDYDVFNHFRQVSTNKTDGTIQVTETFIVTPSGTNSLPNNAIETFTIDSNQQDGITSVSINGEIQGLANISYSGDGASNSGFYVLTSKYSAASGYFTAIQPRIFDRAKTAYLGITDGCFNRPLNAIVKNRTVGVNPIDGIITYNYSYDTSPSGCITGDCLLSQSISIDDTLAVDVFASQTIPGRAAGPILQDINTTTARVRTVNVELVTLPPTGCSSVSEIYKPVPTGLVDDFISVISGDLLANYSQVFVSTNQQNWNFTVGRYTKTVGFTYNNCTS